jgi:Flp pilus assembly pilin Flp
MLKNFWNDEAGAIISAELVLVLTIAVLAMVTGLASLRDAVVTELADVGAAIGSVDQSYSVGRIIAHSSTVAPFGYTDVPDFCDNGSATSAARCVQSMTAGSTAGLARATSLANSCDFWDSLECTLGTREQYCSRVLFLRDNKLPHSPSQFIDTCGKPNHDGMLLVSNLTSFPPRGGIYETVARVLVGTTRRVPQ